MERNLFFSGCEICELNNFLRGLGKVLKICLRFQAFILEKFQIRKSLE